MILTILSMLVGRPTEQLARRRSGPVFLPPGALSRLALVPCLVFAWRCPSMPMGASVRSSPAGSIHSRARRKTTGSCAVTGYCRSTR
jgi:hypothetical protein